MNRKSATKLLVYAFLYFYHWHTGFGPGPAFAIAGTPEQSEKLSPDTLSLSNVKVESLKAEKIGAIRVTSEKTSSNFGEFGTVNGILSSRLSYRTGLLTFRFDDGYKDVLDSVAPLLAEKGWRGVAGIVGCIPPKHLADFMTWKDIKRLHDQYGWEICSHSLTHRLLYDNWTELWREVYLSKKVIEDSASCPIATWIAPVGYDSTIDFYLINSLYSAAIWAYKGRENKPPFNPYHLSGDAIPADSEKIDSIMKVVADSAWWSIVLFHQATPDMQKIRHLIQSAEKHNLKVVTIQEGLKLVGATSSLGVAKISSTIPVSKPNWKHVKLFDTYINLSGPNWNFVDWDNGYPANWVFEFTNPDDSIKQGELSTYHNANIPGKSADVFLTRAQDTVTFTKIFLIEEPVDTAILEIFWNYWFGAVGSWLLKDSISEIYWDAKLPGWVSTETWNAVNQNYPPGTDLYLYKTWITLPESGLYRFSGRAWAPIANVNLRIAAFQVFPTCVLEPPTLSLEFKTPFEGWSVSVKSSLDFIFDNGVGPVLISPNGTKYRLKVDDSGNLSTERIP